MKEILNLPWKSKLFTYGVIAIAFGTGSIIYSYLNTKPNISNLTSFSGTFIKVENMQIKTKNATVIHLINKTDNVRINMGACSKISSELNSGDNLHVYYKKSSLAIVDGRAMQITKDNMPICDFKKAISRHNRSVTLDFYFGVFCLFFGFLSTYAGYKKT